MNRGISSLKSLRFISQPSSALASRTPSPLPASGVVAGTPFRWSEAIPVEYQVALKGQNWDRGFVQMLKLQQSSRSNSSSHLAKLLVDLRNLELEKALSRHTIQRNTILKSHLEQKTWKITFSFLGHPGVDGNVSSAILMEVSSQADFLASKS